MWLWMGGIAAVAALIALVLYLWFRKARPRAGGAKPETPSAVQPEPLEEDASTGESSELERSKLVIHALLQSLSDGLTTLLDDTSTYNDSLERHKNDVKKAMTLAGLKELERVLLTELEQMQMTTVEYRRELDQAKQETQQQREQLEQLQADASLDFLTKIPNRRTFDERLKEEMSRAQRYGSTFSLMVVDIDNFKNVNDLFGHQAGDRILRAVAHILDEQRRASDFLARYGGEEFVVLLPETATARAQVLAEKTRQKVSNARFRYDERTIRVTVSIGVGDYAASTDTWDDLFARVDQALYTAKRNGRNRVEVASTAQPEPQPDA